MSNNEPLDPSGHTSLVVSNFDNSYPFYKDVFVKLGYAQVSNEKDGAGWVSQQGYGIWVSQADITNYPYRFSAPGLHHLCLKAISASAVNDIYKLLFEKGTYVFDEPKKYPNYTDKYYAVFFADPDGIKLEVAYY